jgi:hypothetical protein
MPVRPLKASDHALILDSWLKSYRGSPAARFIHDDVYYGHMREAVGYWLDREPESFAILCAPTEEDVIQGWSCSAAGGLHYIFVGSAFRGLHLARSLIPSDIRRYSHFTLAARPLLEALGCKWDKSGVPLSGGPQYDPWSF